MATVSRAVDNWLVLYASPGFVGNTHAADFVEGHDDHALPGVVDEHANHDNTSLHRPWRSREDQTVGVHRRRIHTAPRWIRSGSRPLGGRDRETYERGRAHTAAQLHEFVRHHIRANRAGWRHAQRLPWIQHHPEVLITNSQEDRNETVDHWSDGSGGCGCRSDVRRQRQPDRPVEYRTLGIYGDAVWHQRDSANRRRRSQWTRHRNGDDERPARRLRATRPAVAPPTSPPSYRDLPGGNHRSFLVTSTRPRLASMVGTVVNTGLTAASPSVLDGAGTGNLVFNDQAVAADVAQRIYANPAGFYVNFHSQKQRGWCRSRPDGASAVRKDEGRAPAARARRGVAARARAGVGPREH